MEEATFSLPTAVSGPEGSLGLFSTESNGYIFTWKIYFPVNEFWGALYKLKDLDFLYCLACFFSPGTM